MRIVYTQWLGNDILLRQLYDARNTRPLPLYVKGVGTKTNAVVHNYSNYMNLFVPIYYNLAKTFRALILLLVIILINNRLVMQWW